MISDYASYIKENNYTGFEVGMIVIKKSRPEFGLGVVKFIDDRGDVFIDFQGSRWDRKEYDSNWSTDNRWFHDYEVVNKKIKRIENPDVDPFGEEDWGYEEIKESSKRKWDTSLDKLYDVCIRFNSDFLENLKNMCVNKVFIYKDSELVASGKNIKFYVLIGMGHDIIKTKNRGPLISCSKTEDQLVLGFEDGQRLNIGKTEFKHYTITNYLIKRIISDVDPYGEEDWGDDMNESKKYDFNVGDLVYVNGIIDEEEFHDFPGTITKEAEAEDDMWIDRDKEGKCKEYCYTGKIYLIGECHWWVSPYNLKPRKINRKISKLDPYGEENWDD